MNFRLHKLFDTTDCIEEIVRPGDSNIFQSRSPLPGIHSLGVSTPVGNRNSSHVRTTHNYPHAAHHAAIQHFHDVSPSTREREIGTRLADIQLIDRGYRGGDDDDDLMIGGGSSGGMIELRDLGTSSNRKISGASQLPGSGYENPRRDSNASLTDLTRTSYVEASKAHEHVDPTLCQATPNENVTISAETIRERVAAASVTRVAAARAVFASATSNLRRRSGNRNTGQNRRENNEEQSNKFDLEVDLHSDPSAKEGYETWKDASSCDNSNNDDVLEHVFGRRSFEFDKVKSFVSENAHEVEQNKTTNRDHINGITLEMSVFRSDDVVVIVDESSPEHQLHPTISLKKDKRRKSSHRENGSNHRSARKSNKSSECLAVTQKTNKLSRPMEEYSRSKETPCQGRELTNEHTHKCIANDETSSESSFKSGNKIHGVPNVSIASDSINYMKSNVIKEMGNETFLDCKNDPGGTSSGHPRRRFSNLSNLAQSLPSTSSSASALMHSRAGLGSVDLAAILNRGHGRGRIGRNEGQNNDKEGSVPVSSSCVRRTQSELVACSSATALSTKNHSPVHKPKIATKKPNIKLKDGKILTNHDVNDDIKSDSENVSEEEEREVDSGSRSPLLTRSRSLEKINCRQFGTVSFDPTAGDCFNKPLHSTDSRNREYSIYSSDMDMETYQAELQEATNALLDARKYLIACDKSEVSEHRSTCSKTPIIQNSRKSSLSVGQQKTSFSGALSVPEANYFTLDNPDKRDKGGNPNYLGVVGPLDWLFSDSEPEPGPSSPKLVHQQGNKSDPNGLQILSQIRRQRTNNNSCSSQGSSGTDTETRSLLAKEKTFTKEKDDINDNTVLTETHTKGAKSIDFKATGAIPKKRANPVDPATESTILDKEVETTSKSQSSQNDFQIECDIADESLLQDKNIDSSLKSISSCNDPHQQQRRSFKLLSRRRPPTPPTGSNQTSATKDMENESFLEPCKNRHPLAQFTDVPSSITSESTSGTTEELKQRILEILSSSSPEECQRELAKLKKELENRNKQMAAALCAAQLPNQNKENPIPSTAIVSDRKVGHKNEGENSLNSASQRRRKHKSSQRHGEEDNQTQTESTSDKHRNIVHNPDDEVAISHNERRRRRRAERRRIEREERAKSTKGLSEVPNSNATSAASTIPSTPALVNILAAGSAVDNVSTHLATDHEDTTEGAIHCFQDEFGNWHSYTFGQESSGTARTVASAAAPTTNTVSTFSSARSQVSNLYSTHGLETPLERNSRTNSNVSLDSFTSGLTVILDSPAMSFQPKRSSSINNSGALPGDDVEEECSQSGGTLGSIAGSSITNRTRYERRRSSSDRRTDVGTSYMGQRSTGVFSHQLSVVDRPFDRQQSNTTNSTLGSASGTYRSHRSPLHLFAESLLERTRLAASAATTAVGNTQSQVITYL